MAPTGQDNHDDREHHKPARSDRPFDTSSDVKHDGSFKYHNSHSDKEDIESRKSLHSHHKDQPQTPSMMEAALSPTSHHYDDDDELPKPPTDPSTLEKQPSLSKVLSSRSMTPSLRAIGPPPDGGLHAWMQVLMAHLVVVSSWGFIISFGVFQAYYTRTMPGRSLASISWIGSVQLFLTFIIGSVSGRALDAGYFRPVFAAGMALQAVGIFCTAEAHASYWQTLLAQGVCIGIANGLQFCPTLSLLSTYFAKRKGLAIGIVACGSSVGGLVYPSVARELLPRVGFAWTVRVLGFITLATNLAAICVLRPRLPPRKQGRWIEWAALKEAPFVLYCAGMFLQLWGLFFAFYYIGTYALTIAALPARTAIALLLVMNGIGIPGRLLTNTVSDTLTGPLNAMSISTFLLAILMFGWIGVGADRTSLWVFAAVYGFVAAGVQGLFPAALASLTADLRRAGARMGMGFLIVSLACLTGPPLAGVLVGVGGGGDGSNEMGYLYAQVWAGSAMLLGSLLVCAARVTKAGWTVKVKV